MAWLAAVSEPSTPYGDFVIPFVLCTGMALVFAPSANAVLSAVRPEEDRRPVPPTPSASWAACSASAVLASVFSANGSYASPAAYVDGMTAAVPVGAAVLALGAIAALFVPARRRTESEAPRSEAVPAAA